MMKKTPERENNQREIYISKGNRRNVASTSTAAVGLDARRGAKPLEV
jgi:hypothetical protein